VTAGPWRRELVAPLAAVALLSVVPVARLAPSDPRTLSGSVKWFPVVGAAMGLALAASDVVLRSVLSMTTATALELVGLVLLSGGLHLDGLADTADGLVPLLPRDRRLEVMHAPTIGAFGAIAVGLTLMVEFAALAEINSGRAQALIVVATVSRWCMSLMLVAFPSAAPGGLGSAFRKHVTRRDLLVATVLALFITWLVSGPLALVFLTIAAAVGLLVGWWAVRQIGGCSGDVYGAASELCCAAGFVLAAAVMRV
jgi:adenosylcobinamide-GDP ribazoletransferase